MAIFNCPECGSKISTKAVSCPHCGIKIAGNIEQCPECGEYYMKGTIETCKNCGVNLNETDTLQAEKKYEDTVANENTPDNIAPVGNITNQVETETESNETPYNTTSGGSFYSTPAPQPQVPKNNRKKKTIWIAVVFSIIVFAGIGYLIYHNSTKIEEEETRYSELMENFSVADAETFLLRYPETKHANEIKDQITLYQRYESEWVKIVDSENIDDFVVFERKFPGSPFIKKAQDKIDSLDWASAKKINTLKSVQNYLNLHPKGKFITQALDLKQEIIDATPNSEEVSRVTNAIVRYFNALSQNNRDVLANITTSAVYNKSCEYIDSKSSSEAVTYNITSPVSVEKFPADNGYSYTATCTIDRASADINGATSRKSFSVKATLTSYSQISSMNMRPLN